MLRSETDGPVLRLTLNRPEVRNALDDRLIDALARTFSELSYAIRVVVLSGEGPAFCAGGDLNWTRRALELDERANVEDTLRLTRVFEAITRCPALVISRVNGAARGAGCGLVAASDYAVCAPDVKFAFSEVRLGLVPATILPFVLPKIGPSNARALFTTGLSFDAERAREIGLVHETAEDIDVAVSRVIRSVLRAGPKAVAEAKRLAQSAAPSIDGAAHILARVRLGEEAREGVAAFLEKRRPYFRADNAEE